MYKIINIVTSEEIGRNYSLEQAYREIKKREERCDLRILPQDMNGEVTNDDHK